MSGALGDNDGLPATITGSELSIQTVQDERGGKPTLYMIANGVQTVNLVDPTTTVITRSTTIDGVASALLEPGLEYVTTATTQVSVGTTRVPAGHTLRVVNVDPTGTLPSGISSTSAASPGASNAVLGNASGNTVAVATTSSANPTSGAAAQITKPVIYVDVHLEILDARDTKTTITTKMPYIVTQLSNDVPVSRLYYINPPSSVGLNKRQEGGAFFTVAASAVPTTIRQAQSGGSGLSTGAGAGIGIGCAVVGALIAFLVASFLFKRKRKGRPRRRHLSRGRSSDSEGYDLPDSKMIPTATTVAIPQNSAAAAVFNNKPLPKEDNYITDEFSRIKTRIDGHINTYYLRSGGNEKAALDAFAQLWAAQSPVPLNRVPSLLADSRSRAHILRAGVAWIITRRIVAGSGGAAESFLPAGIANAYADLTNNRMEPQTRSAFLSEWRVMTASLSSSLYGGESINPDDSRLASVRVALGQADKFLGPLASSADHEPRIRHLEEIMKRATRLGWTLFSQPSEFQTDWADEGRGVVVFPSLLQTTDEDGRGLRPPRVFGQKEVIPL